MSKGAGQSCELKESEFGISITSHRNGSNGPWDDSQKGHLTYALIMYIGKYMKRRHGELNQIIIMWHSSSSDTVATKYLHRFELDEYLARPQNFAANKAR